MGKNVFELQESMYPNHKWNKAVYTLEKNGHFDITFEWNQALQDEWDNAQGGAGRRLARLFCGRMRKHRRINKCLR